MTTPRDDLLAALNHEETDITPYAIGFLEEPAERMDRHFGAEAWRGAIRRYTAGWSLPIERTLIDAERALYRDEFGCLWQHGSIWHLVEPALKGPSLAGFRWPDVAAPARYEAMAGVCRDNPDRFRVAYLTVSFFEQYWKMRGWEGLTDFADNERFAEALLDRFLEMMLAIIERIGDAPFDCIGITDDQSDQRGVTIGAPRWRRMLLPRFRTLFERIHATGRIAFLHCCGNVMEILPDLIDAGLDWLNPLQPECMDVYALKREYGRHLLLEGGIGTQRLLPFGTPDDIRAEVQRLRLRLGEGGGYIIAPAKAVRPETPTENILALYEALVRQPPRRVLAAQPI